MKIDNGTIVLVADGSRRLLLRNDGDTVYPDLRVLAHDRIANAPNHEQMSDAPGLVFSSMGFNRSTYEHENPHQQAEDQFAARAAHDLDDLLAKEAGDVVVVAPPDTLGELRRHYSQAVRSRLAAEIDRDLVKHSVEDITRHIMSYEP